MSRSTPISTRRLYGALIAFASGGYSVLVASTGRTLGAGLMLLLGVVVVVHGAVLLTSWAPRLGAASGPLMIAYAVLMVANQARLAAVGGMAASPGMGMTGPMAGMAASWDPGMVVLALLMLASGVVMTVRRETM